MIRGFFWKNKKKVENIFFSPFLGLDIAAPPETFTG
jgi:hypothetical protein